MAHCFGKCCKLMLCQNKKAKAVCHYQVIMSMLLSGVTHSLFTTDVIGKKELVYELQCYCVYTQCYLSCGQLRKFEAVSRSILIWQLG